MGLLRGDLIARQQELQRASATDDAREALRAGVSGDEAKVDFRLPEPSGVRRDPQRARHRKLAAAAERVAVDRGDDGLAELLDGVHDPLAATRQLPTRRRRLYRQFADVRTGNERLLASTGHDYDTHGLVVTERRHRATELVERVMVERVQDLRTIDGEDGDGTVVCEQQVVKRHNRGVSARLP